MDTLTINDSDEEDCPSQSAIPIQSSNLPIFSYKDKIVEIVAENQIVVIQGQTGCGKTTQIPQYLLEAGLNRKRMIGITQPRKIAAISMAKRVSRERESALGKEVGYEIRFDKMHGASTKIKYMTEGILLNECVTNRALPDYGIIIIDEAHERSVNSDVLLGLLRKITSSRPDLKLLITSATITMAKFHEYFDRSTMLIVEGRLYPIEVIYNTFHPNYVELAVKTIKNIHRDDIDGDILVFLTGEDEIEDCCYHLEVIDNLVVKPLYGSLDFETQQDVFTKVKPGVRKVVVSTNIAETSITIEGVRFVVDCGYVKQSNFVSSRGIDTLETVKISKAQAEQRKGRAGRMAPGWCYRLYTETMYEKFQDEATPEVHRKNLSEIYLKLLSIPVNPKEFEFIDRPTNEELERSEQDLLDLSLIEANGDLTDISRKMSEFPVEPRLGKVVIMSLSNKCTVDILKIMSMLSEKNIFNNSKKHRREADSKRQRFFDEDGDHFTFLNVYNEWLKNYNSKNIRYTHANIPIIPSKFSRKKEDRNARQWCRSNFINFHSIQNADKVFDQIHQMVKKNQNINDISGDKNAIKRSIVSGYFKNICVNHSRDAYMRFYGRETVFIHPQSSMFQSRPKIVLFHELFKTKKSFMHGVLKLDESLIKEFPKELEIIKYTENLKDLFAF